jgi:hypothetical protein
MLKVILPALIALAGTLVVALIGYRQWRRQQTATREEDFRKQQKETYKELWNKLEDVHVKLRVEDVPKEDFRSMTREVNTYVLKNSLYLDKKDQELANDYLSQVRRFVEIVESSGVEAAMETLNDTGFLTANVCRCVRELSYSQNEMEKVRDALIARYRKVLRGEVP